MGNPQSSDPVDPLSDFSLISLFPRTFNRCSLDSGPDPRCNDLLVTVGAHLKSMALKSPSRLLEQAKSILDDGLESLNVENLENTRDEDNVGDLAGVNQKKLQGRRPALGRKRARFSLKQNSSQSVECLEPFIEIDKLLDPEEFFSALEKHENAKNELKRQRGTALTDLDQNVPSMAERRRRPGLLRKSASYKHRFSMAPCGDDKNFLSSQEKFSQDICSPSKDCLQMENADQNPVPSTRELSGQIAARIDRSNDISDQLQSGHDDDDDESDEILVMLQERFKPIELKKTSLPDLSGVHRSEFKRLGETLLDSQDKMSHLHDIVSAIGKETTLGDNNMERSSDHHPTSLPPPKSPYASMSLLKARLFQSRQAKDPFSALDIDLSPPGKAACCEDTNNLAARKCEKSVKDMMPLISSANKMHIDSDHATVDDGTRKRNQNSPVHETQGDMVASKAFQDLAAAECTLSEKSIKGNSMMPGIPSETTMHIELNRDIVECDRRDISPKSTMHGKESDTVGTTETVKGGSKMSNVFSDCVDRDTRDQDPNSAAHEKEINTIHSKDMHVLDAKNFLPSKKTMKDSSIVSELALNNTATHIELDLDHDIMANHMRATGSEDNPSEAFDDAVITANELDDRVTEGDAQGPTVEKSNRSKKQSTADALEDLEKSRPSSDHDEQCTTSVIDGHDQDRPSSSQAQPFKEPKASSQKTEHKRRKGKESSHPHDTNFLAGERRKATATYKQTRERKEFSRRKSLAACGTQWESGLRRSTRIRTRPLEYWKGERQLYGRIHESLVTVIGTKYLSPGKETGQPTLKVKSYVPAEYKEIVEQAALH